MLLAGAGCFANESAAQETTLIYDTTTPNIVSVTADGYIIYKAKVAGTMTAIIRAITVSVIEDGGPRDGRAPVVLATSFASITLRGLESCSISGGCDAFGLQNLPTPSRRLASLFAMNLQTVAMFAASGADLNEYAVGAAGEGALLSHLAGANKPAHASVFVAAGASINGENFRGRTPLHESAEQGFTAAITILAALSANLNARDNGGATPLQLAAIDGHETIVSLLASLGASVNARNQQGRTPLHSAAEREKTAVITLLAALSLDVNARDNLGRTPLHLAAIFGHASAITLLASLGASINARENNEETPLHFAALIQHTAVISLLASLGASINARDLAGETPLHRVAIKGNTALISLLNDLGASINAQDNAGDTPLDEAVKRNKPEAAALLRTLGGICSTQSGRPLCSSGFAGTSENAATSGTSQLQSPANKEFPGNWNRQKRKLRGFKTPAGKRLIE